MSKGFEWAKARASDPTISGLADRDWSKAMEWPFTAEIISSVVADIGPQWEKSGEWYWLKGHTFGEFRVMIVHAPDTDFDYFTCDGCVCDGTLAFTTDMIRGLIYKVATVQTYDKRLFDKLNSRTFEEIKWTIGNFVTLSEYGKRFAPEEKPWMNERVTVLLPLKMEVS